MIVYLTKEFKFEASHQLPYHEGKCAQLHGHSWVLNVMIGGHVQGEFASDLPISPTNGMVMDYSDIKDAVQPIVEMLDHHHLGSGYITADEHLLTLGFPTNPTSENIIIWISQQLPSSLPWIMLKLHETCTSEAILFRHQEVLWIPN